jgi:catechol 2,3-dioxygenase-like lactoylglutathione lyase family enzyme
MKATLKTAWGYKGDQMSLPVRSLDDALPFYQSVLGFEMVSRDVAPHAFAVLGRDGIEIGLAENGGDPAQDGCAFEVDDVESLFAEFKGNGLQKELSAFDVELHGGASWKVFYVVAPDGLCYWFGQREAGAGAG